MGMMLTIHPEKCTGCRNCELACAMEHEGEFRIKASRIHVYAWEREAFSVPMMCQQCSDAACATVCMPKALSKDPSTGMVDYDASKCIGCKACQTACLEWNDLNQPIGSFEGSYNNPTDLTPASFTVMIGRAHV